MKEMESSYDNLKKWIFETIDDTDETGKPNHCFDYFIISLIFLNIFAIFLESIPYYRDNYSLFLSGFEIITVSVFSVEYILRIWTCNFYKEYSHPIKGRIKFALTPKMLIDLLAVFPFYLAITITLDPRIVNLFRLLRLFRIFKLLRYYGTIDVIMRVLKKNKDYFFAVFIILGILLIFTSYLIYAFESAAQPDKFGDMVASLWWSVVTLTTVGYGDIYPITPIGRFLTIGVLLIGIGIFALPTGIIASGFLEEMRATREETDQVPSQFIADELRKLYDLKNEGIISEIEYIKEKERLLTRY